MFIAALGCRCSWVAVEWAAQANVKLWDRGRFETSAFSREQFGLFWDCGRSALWFGQLQQVAVGLPVVHRFQANAAERQLEPSESFMLCGFGFGSCGHAA